MSMWDAVVVGGGIVGATVASALELEGCQVLLLDDGRTGSGTVPSGGHLKPSWFGGLPKAEYEPAMELLDRCWTLHSEEFAVREPLLGSTLTHTTVYRVDTDQVVNRPKTLGRVTALHKLDNYPLVCYRTCTDSDEGGVEDDGFGSSNGSQFEDHEVRCKLLVVATGAWAAQLVEGVQVQAKAGVSFRMPGTLAAPFVQPWAPYRQVVAHQQGDKEIWVGDGTAVLAENWSTERTTSCLTRCVGALGLNKGTQPLRTLQGNRPYCKTEGKDPCLLKRLGKRAWLATGAGKSGTIAAGWAARRIIDAATI